jgi:xanthine dehydrogenase accessory factor
LASPNGALHQILTVKMHNTEFEVLSKTLHWLEQGKQVILITVVKTWGTAPRPVGALLAVREDGIFVGSVSGGCVEEEIAQRVRAGEIKRPTVLTYGVTTEQSQHVGLPCGGTIELLSEPLTEVDSIKPAVTALEQRQLIARQLNIVSGQVTWQTAPTEQTLRYNGQQLIIVYGPIWQLLIIGAGQISRYLSEFALALNYQVTICDPRQEYTTTWQTEGTRLDNRMPDDTVKALIQDKRSAVVALTHDPKLDDMALLEALNSSAFYVGALGSKSNNEKRRKRLARLGISEEALARLHAPVGLPIGSHTPPEIAIAILAEITAVRNKIVQDKSWTPAPPYPKSLT